jgi:GTPase SAR1 family protein
MIVVYLIGVAGVGKSTTVTELSRDWTLRSEQSKPFAHRHYTTPHGKAVIMGKNVQPFGGTDTLSWTAINEVENFLTVCSQRNIELVVGEGDRFANDRFLDTATKIADHVLLYHLTADEDTTKKRRGDRSALWGTKQQNEKWVQGRQTKTDGLSQRWGATPLDARLPSSTIAQTITKEIDRCRSNDPA